MTRKGFSFGKSSLKNISECHLDLQKVLHTAIEIIDFSVIQGERNEEDQNKAYDKGLSKLRYPQSKHNHSPSLAVDIVPYPIDWNDRERFCLLAGIIKGMAHTLGVNIRWGGDFNGNNIMSDDTFSDLPHFELAGDRK